ncbi:hypothetical protein JJ691_64370 [Kutzneria sp. CA-103260]|nr:hypothetical protein JJ691_64370 [Kutzneria sp. CA-103260]
MCVVMSLAVRCPEFTATMLRKMIDDAAFE